jgi:hypothetical protein
VTFGQTPLPLPLSVKVTRRAEPLPLGGDADDFATSVQLDTPAILAEVRVRGTAAAEALSLGRQATLAFTVAPAESGKPSRTIALAGAVLVAVELSYEQSALATATLRFAAEAGDGETDPFSAENAP